MVKQSFLWLLILTAAFSLQLVVRAEGAEEARFEVRGMT